MKDELRREGGGDAANPPPRGFTSLPTGSTTGAVEGWGRSLKRWS